MSEVSKKQPGRKQDVSMRDLARKQVRLSMAKDLDWELIRKQKTELKLSIEKIARYHHVREKTISNGLKRMGVEVKRQINPGAQPKLDIDWEQARENYEAGYSTPECARMAGCSAGYMGNKLRAMGVKMRGRHDAKPASTAKIWLQSRGYTMAYIASRAGVAGSSVSHYLSGYLGYSERIEGVLTEIGCPKRLMYKEERKRVKEEEQARELEKQRKLKSKYWDPWADGDILCPPGVESNNILMCAF